MFRSFINTLNIIQAQVWQSMQYLCLVGIVIYGGHLLINGHDAAGTGLISGSFALLRSETAANKPNQS